MGAPSCLLSAWSAHEGELRGYLRHRMHNADDAEDLLQEVFLKALRQGGRFCDVDNARAWLFQVARNALADRLRVVREQVSLPGDDELAMPAGDERAPVEGLSQCLPRVLAELSADDRLALTLCDISGASQQDLADQLGITLPGAKSRIQRARARLRKRLLAVCKVDFDEAGKVSGFTPRPPE